MISFFGKSDGPNSYTTLAKGACFEQYANDIQHGLAEKAKAATKGQDLEQATAQEALATLATAKRKATVENARQKAADMLAAKKKRSSFSLGLVEPSKDAEEGGEGCAPEGLDAAP